MQHDQNNNPVQYVIRSLSEGQDDLDGNIGAFWSNADGWGDLASATRFCTKERMGVHLPMSRGGDSEWMLVEEAIELSCESAAMADNWTPTFTKWRHGGWYVSNLHYPNGASGCVSKNYPDGK